MSTRVQMLTDQNSCLMKAAEDEPLFVLRARDPLAAECVRYWANRAISTGSHEPDKGMSAHTIADAMLEWRRKWVDRHTKKGEDHAS